MTNILIGTPCYSGLATTEYLASLLGLQNELGRLGIDFSLEMPSTSLITVARNYVVSKVLQNAKFSHLLFIDADIGFDPRVIPRYLAAQKDIVAGVYPIKHLNLPAIRQLPAAKSVASTFHYAVTIGQGRQTVSDGLVRAEYAATGFMLIRREVLERMAAHHPELKYQHSFTHLPGEAAGSEHLYALFDTSIDPEQRIYLPEDYTFCRRWTALGGEIWVDVESKLRHVGNFVYEGDFSVFVDGK